MPLIAQRLSLAVWIVAVAFRCAAAQTGSDSPTQSKYKAGDFDTAYVVTKTTTVYAEASKTSRVVGRLKRFDIPRIIEARAGWAHVLYVPPEGATEPEYDGWIEGGTDEAKEHVMNTLDAALRIGHLEKQPWPPEIVTDALLGRVRPGFTKEQVLAAHVTLEGMDGEPLRKRKSETATGVKEVWIYAKHTIRFVGNKVVEIESTE